MARKIPLSGERGKGKFTVVDDSDYEWAMQFKWYIDHGGYAYRRITGGRIYLHRELLPAPRNKEVDHKNTIRLDNTRSNLRLASATQNRRNSTPRTNTISPYKGVTLYRHTWRARIVINYKSIHLGFYATQREAALAYNHAARKYFGEFARLNVIDETLDDEPLFEPRRIKTSPYRGVHRKRGTEGWFAKICVRQQTIELGRFDTEIKAAKAYDAAAQKYHGDSAKLNFP